LVPPLPIQPKVTGPACDFGNATPRTGIFERTLLVFHVDPRGEIIDANVLDSSGNAALNEAAIRCLHSWRADPSEFGQFGSLRAHIFWNAPAARLCLGKCLVGTFTVNRISSCEGFYPPDKARAKIGGTTFVKYHVTTEGNVADPEVTQSSGDAELDQAARSCVQFWRYRPATQNGQPIDFVRQAAIKWAPQ
jgi:TonB family protein